MVNQGLTIMATGMLIVFAFLAIMVIAMRLMSGMLLKFFPEKKATATIKNEFEAQAGELELAIAIAAAHMGHK